MPITPLDWENRSSDALRTKTGLRAEWDRLNSCRINLPFLTADVVVSALQVFGGGNERLLIAKQRGEVVAMFLVVSTGLLQWRTFQPSQMPLGCWVATPTFSASELARSVLKKGLGFSLAFSITQIDPFLASREPDQPDFNSIDYIETGWIDIQGTFEDYWAARGKNLRQNMRKQRNKLAVDGVNIKMRVLTNPENMEVAIARYGVLESSGWKSSENTAIHPDNAQGKFYIQVMKNAAKIGQAVVYEYLFNEKTVALNLCIQRGETLVVLKTTYDETIKNYSPAFLLNQDQVEMVFGQGVIKRLEYYGRMMEWHTRWTENKRTLYHLTCYRWPWLKKLAEHRQKRKLESSSAELLPEPLVENNS